VVDEHADLGSLGGRFADVRILLDEVVDRLGLPPRFVVEDAVDANGRGDAMRPNGLGRRWSLRGERRNEGRGEP